MKTSQFPLFTLREVPADAEVISHQWMLRTGMIRKLAAGIYTWLPLGLRTLDKIAQIVREEMNRAGALEILMPAVQPAELWEESGRWSQYGPELLRLKDRHQRSFCIGPTHEEVITDLVRQNVKSYKQLPLNFYQIQTKFRDEVRPRFGVMRGREFLMKDAYSFDFDETGMQASYDKMYTAYCKIFTRLGLDFRAVAADSGAIGGNRSQEFQVLAESGEDVIVFTSKGYAANRELVALSPIKRPTSKENLTEISTPKVHTIQELCTLTGLSADKTIKTLIVAGKESLAVALCLRGDHELNPVKAEKHPLIATPLRFLTGEEIKNLTGTDIGSLGPNLANIPTIADYAAAATVDFCCGANKNGFHLTGVNWGKDVSEPQTADLRFAVAGDQGPDGDSLQLARGIEVGHIFQLGDKYSKALKLTVLDEQGRDRTVQMGCYGIGVSRIAAAAIEQNHDGKGIRWPVSIAPFHVGLIPVNLHKSYRLREQADVLYNELRNAGFEVLYDDREARLGVMLTDMEMIGLPVRIILSEKHLDANQVEIQGRLEDKSRIIARAELLEIIKQYLNL